MQSCNGDRLQREKENERLFKTGLYYYTTNDVGTPFKDVIHKRQLSIPIPTFEMHPYDPSYHLPSYPLLPTLPGIHRVQGRHGSHVMWIFPSGYELVAKAQAKNMRWMRECPLVPYSYGFYSSQEDAQFPHTRGPEPTNPLWIGDWCSGAIGLSEWKRKRADRVEMDDVIAILWYLGATLRFAMRKTAKEQRCHMDIEPGHIMMVPCWMNQWVPMLWDWSSSVQLAAEGCTTGGIKRPRTLLYSNGYASIALKTTTPEAYKAPEALVLDQWLHRLDDHVRYESEASAEEQSKTTRDFIHTIEKFYVTPMDVYSLAMTTLVLLFGSLPWITSDTSQGEKTGYRLFCRTPELYLAYQLSITRPDIALPVAQPLLLLLATMLSPSPPDRPTLSEIYESLQKHYQDIVTKCEKTYDFLAQKRHELLLRTTKPIFVEQCRGMNRSYTSDDDQPIDNQTRVKPLQSKKPKTQSNVVEVIELD